MHTIVSLPGSKKASLNCYARADSFVNFLTSYTGKHSIFAATGINHIRLRPILSAPLSHHHITTYLQHSFFARGDQLAFRLLDSKGCDPLESVRKGTFSVVADACFGPRFLTAVEHDQLFALYDQALSMKPAIVVARVLLTGFPIQLPFHWVAKSERAKVELREIVKRMCVRLLASSSTTSNNDIIKKKSNDEDQSLLRHMLQLSITTVTAATTHDENNNDDTTTNNNNRSTPRTRIDDTTPLLSANELTDAVLSFLVAGQATSAIAVSWILYLLAKHPQWQTHLCSELHDHKPNNLTTLDSLPILDAIIRETLRLYPPLPFAMRKVANPTAAGVTLQGCFLPNQTIVRVALLALHTDEKVWGPDAWEFNPDRWLRDVSGRGGIRAGISGVDERFVWGSFWFGGHSCIGYRFAMLEIKAFVMKIVNLCRISVDEKCDGAPYRWAVDSTPIGMKLYFTKRDDGVCNQQNG